MTFRRYFYDSHSTQIMDNQKPLETQLTDLANYVSSLERRLLAAEQLLGAFKIYQNVESNGDFEKQMPA